MYQAIQLKDKMDDSGITKDDKTQDASSVIGLEMIKLGVDKVLWFSEEEGEAETLIKDKRLFSVFLRSFVNLSNFYSTSFPHHTFFFSPHLLQWQAHSPTLCSMPAAWEIAIQPSPSRLHTHTHIVCT